MIRRIFDYAKYEYATISSMTRKQLIGAMQEWHYRDAIGFSEAVHSIIKPKLEKISLHKWSLPLLLLVCGIVSFLVLVPAIWNWNFWENISSQHIFYGTLLPLGIFLAWYLGKKVVAPHINGYDKTVLGVAVLLFGFMLAFPTFEKIDITQYPSHQNIQDTFLTSSIAIYGVLWFALAFSHLGKLFWTENGRREFLRYFFDASIHALMIEIGGIILTAFTLTLFSQLLGWQFQNWYTTWIVPAGAISAIPVGIYLSARAVSLRKLTTLLAHIFTPLFFITLVSYIVVAIINGKSPYVDRNFLLTCNVVLLAIMGLVHLSLNSEHISVIFQKYLMTGLLIITAALNLVALGSIVLRLANYGFTPNRIVVLGTNIVVFGHLLTLLPIGTRVRRLTTYWSVYIAWSLIVAVIVPFIFGFR